MVTRSGELDVNGEGGGGRPEKKAGTQDILELETGSIIISSLRSIFQALVDLGAVDTVSVRSRAPPRARSKKSTRRLPIRPDRAGMVPGDRESGWDGGKVEDRKEFTKKSRECSKQLK
jgi:hypothetical protein